MLDQRHAAEVLKRLGLEDCFERIMCFETFNPINKDYILPTEDEKNAPDVSSEIFDIMDYKPSSGVLLPETPIVCKPFELAFERAFQIADIDPKTMLFFDDSVRNVSTAKSMHLQTVLIEKSERSNGADYALESIHNIREAFPELLEADEERLENVRYSQKIAVEA